MVTEENKVIIEKLERLDSLLDESLKLSDYIEGGCAIEYSDKITAEIERIGKLQGRPSVFKSMPCFPEGGAELPQLEKTYNSKKKTLTILALCAGVIVLIYFISHLDFLNIIASAMVIATIIFIFTFLQSKSKFITAKNAYDKSVELSNESLNQFKYAISKYDAEKTAGIEAAKQYKKEYISVYKKHLELSDEYADVKQKSMEKFIANIDEARTFDFMPEEYYPLIKNILGMLKSGRADNYKEALNMAIQEQKEAEAEAARRAEEARRTEIMRQQAEAEQRRLEEAERHNREMENQQALQAKLAADEQRKQMQDMQKQQQRAQHEAELANYRANREAERQANKTKGAGIAKCANCANSKHCPSNIKNSGAGLTCGGYVPYGGR